MWVGLLLWSLCLTNFPAQSTEATEKEKEAGAGKRNEEGEERSSEYSDATLPVGERVKSVIAKAKLKMTKVFHEDWTGTLGSSVSSVGTPEGTDEDEDSEEDYYDLD